MGYTCLFAQIFLQYLNKFKFCCFPLKGKNHLYYLCTKKDFLKIERFEITIYM